VWSSRPSPGRETLRYYTLIYLAHRALDDGAHRSVSGDSARGWALEYDGAPRSTPIAPSVDVVCLRAIAVGRPPRRSVGGKEGSPPPARSSLPADAAVVRVYSVTSERPAFALARSSRASSTACASSRAIAPSMQLTPSTSWAASRWISPARWLIPLHTIGCCDGRLRAGDGAVPLGGRARPAFLAFVARSRSRQGAGVLIGSLWWAATSLGLSLATPEWPRWVIFVWVPIVGLGYAVVDLMPCRCSAR